MALRRWRVAPMSEPSQSGGIISAATTNTATTSASQPSLVARIATTTAGVSTAAIEDGR